MNEKLKTIDVAALEEALKAALEEDAFKDEQIADDILWGNAVSILHILKCVKAWAAQGSISKWSTEPSRNLRRAAEALKLGPVPEPTFQAMIYNWNGSPEVRDKLEAAGYAHKQQLHSLDDVTRIGGELIKLGLDIKTICRDGKYTLYVDNHCFTSHR